MAWLKGPRNSADQEGRQHSSRRSLDLSSWSGAGRREQQPTSPHQPPSPALAPSEQSSGGGSSLGNVLQKLLGTLRQQEPHDCEAAPAGQGPGEPVAAVTEEAEGAFKVGLAPCACAR